MMWVRGIRTADDGVGGKVCPDRDDDSAGAGD